MLKDLGLQTPEQIESFNQFRAARANNLFNKQYHGCVSTDLCRGCNHLFSDPTCMCGGLGICPICGFDNSPKITNISTPSGYKIDMETFSAYSKYTKNDFIKIVDKVFKDNENNYLEPSEFSQELKEEINKL